MDTLQWLTETEFGKCIFTMLVSMIPIIELRGGLPFGVALGLPYHLAFPAAVLGNLIPAPFIIVNSVYCINCLRSAKNSFIGFVFNI